MTYRVEFRPRVLRQLNGFPAAGLDALISVLADVTLYPTDPLRTVPVPARPGERQAVFGGLGLVTYETDDGRQAVVLTDVTWAG